jgi:hypothetical protein
MKSVVVCFCTTRVPMQRRMARTYEKNKRVVAVLFLCSFLHTTRAVMDVYGLYYFPRFLYSSISRHPPPHMCVCVCVVAIKPLFLPLVSCTFCSVCSWFLLPNHAAEV